MNLEKDIREFIVENFLYGATDVRLSGNDSFIEKGIIDSTGVLEVVNFIESKFGITLNDDELTPENLDSISKIVRFINGKLG
jgi:acyl carrier protein